MLGMFTSSLEEIGGASFSISSRAVSLERKSRVVSGRWRSFKGNGEMERVIRSISGRLASISLTRCLRFSILMR